jgi:membrane-associated phospholipid phosphatase
MKKFLVILFTSISSLSALAQSWDYQVIHDLNVVNRPKNLDKPFQFISNSTGAVTIGVPVAMVAAGLFTHNKNLLQQGEQVAIAFGVSTISTWALKLTVKRDRPFVTHPDIIKLSDGGGSSFPSGHASSAFALATSLFLENKKWYVGVPAFTWASLVAYSRVDLGVHYPSDVLAGAALGVGSAFAARKINRWIHKEKPVPTTAALF